MTLAILLAAQRTVSENVSIFDPVSPPAESIRGLTILVLAIIGTIFVLVEGVLFYAVFRFRRGRPKDATEPPQVYGSDPIEIAWTAAPALVVFILTLVITRTLWEVEGDTLKPPKPARPLHVTVIGHQWWWEYAYERSDDKSLGFITANELHVPASDRSSVRDRRPVYLALQSADVCHSFWVPRLAGKTDLIPGRTNRMWFETGNTGLFLGQCAEFCGTQHAKMLLRVYVEPPEEFNRWAENEMKPAVEDPRVAEGKKVFLAHSCINCHRVRGTKAAGTYAPDLTHLMSRKTLASGIIENNRETLKQWVADPQKIKPGCLMPAFDLSERELDSVVDYLATLR